MAASSVSVAILRGPRSARAPQDEVGGHRAAFTHFRCNAGMTPSDERLIDLYLDMLAAERGAAANTLEAYRRDLTDFSAALTAHRGSIAKADSENIRDYLGRLAGRGFSAASVARRLSAIRQLYRFLYAEGNRKDDPAAAIEGAKRGRALDRKS